MPYIHDDARLRISQGSAPRTPGELNYAITELLIEYLTYEKLSYSTLNTIIGTLESVKSEFYRRVVKPYEDKKMRENGDVYYGTGRLRL